MYKATKKIKGSHINMNIFIELFIQIERTPEGKTYHRLTATEEVTGNEIRVKNFSSANENSWNEVSRIVENEVIEFEKIIYKAKSPGKYLENPLVKTLQNLGFVIKN